MKWQVYETASVWDSPQTIWWISRLIKWRVGEMLIGEMTQHDKEVSIMKKTSYSFSLKRFKEFVVAWPDQSSLRSVL